MAVACLRHSEFNLVGQGSKKDNNFGGKYGNVKDTLQINYAYGIWQDRLNTRWPEGPWKPMSCG